MTNLFKTIRCTCGDFHKHECWRGTSITVHHTHGVIYFNHKKSADGKKDEKFQSSIYLDEKSTDKLIKELELFKETQKESKVFKNQ